MDDPRTLLQTHRVQPRGVASALPRPGLEPRDGLENR
jgi:hypothetical protein